MIFDRLHSYEDVVLAGEKREGAGLTALGMGEYQGEAFLLPTQLLAVDGTVVYGNRRLPLLETMFDGDVQIGKVEHLDSDGVGGGRNIELAAGSDVRVNRGRRCQHCVTRR